MVVTLTRVQLVHGGPQDGDADHPPGPGRERLPVRLGERAGDRPRAQRARAEGQLRRAAAPGRQYAMSTVVLLEPQRMLFRFRLIFSYSFS